MIESNPFSKRLWERHAGHMTFKEMVAEDLYDIGFKYE